MGALHTSLIAAAHLLGVVGVFTFGAMRLSALRSRDVAAIRLADNGNGLAALLVYGAGLYRLFAGLEKPLAYYTANGLFWAKVVLLLIVTLLEIYPQVVVFPWHVRHARKLPIEVREHQFSRMFVCAALQLPCLVAVVFCAAGMARGVDAPRAREQPTRGETVYVTRCASCHGLDGRGRGGTLAADFTNPEGVLSRSDPALLRSIEHGVQGNIGTMPPFGASLDDDERRGVLAFVRERFGR